MTTDRSKLRDSRSGGLTRLPRPTAVVLAHAHLRQMILMERLKPGEWLRQEDLARVLSMSRMPVREALRLLSEEGLVEFSPHRGARVTPLSLEELEEIYGARMGLEGFVARYAALQISAQVLETLRLALPRLAALSAASDMDTYLHEDRLFMQTCYAVSGRPRLCRQIASLRERAERYLRLVFETGDRVHWVDYSYRLFQACVAHDPEAAESAVQGALRWTFSQATALFDRSNAELPEPHG